MSETQLPQQQNPSFGASQARTTPQSEWSARLINLVLIPLLVIAALLLPPVSLAERIANIGFTTIGEEIWTVEDPDGTQLAVVKDTVVESLKLKLSSVPRLNFLEGSAGKKLIPAAEALPANLVVKSPLYRVQRRGESAANARLRIPVPNDAEPYETLDLYGWDGQSWLWLPSQTILSEDVIVSEIDSLPEDLYVAVAQTGAPVPLVAAELPAATALPDEAAQTLTEINPIGLYLGEEGELVVRATALIEPADSYLVVPTIRNWSEDNVVRSEALDDVLTSVALREKHIAAIVNFVVQQGYPGVELDYRRINPDLRDSYTLFVTELAEKLHQSGRLLSVRVERPTQLALDDWDAGSYDWLALGRVADAIKVPVPFEPRSFVAGGSVEQMIVWAVGQVNRYKLQLALSVRGVEMTDSGLRPVAYADALAPLSRVAVGNAQTMFDPGAPVTFALTALSQTPGIAFDESIGTYWFSYADERNNQHTVWLENEASLAHKLQMMARFNLRGVTLEHLIAPGNDPQIWQVARSYRDGTLVPQQTDFAVVWQVHSAAGGKMMETTGDLTRSEIVWQAPETPGAYEMSAVIAADGLPVSEGEAAVFNVAEPTPTPTSTPLPTPTNTPLPTATPTTSPPTPTPTNTPTPTPTKKPQPSQPPGLSVPAPSTGLGLDYGIQAHVWGQQHETIIDSIKGLGFRWLKVQVEWKHHEGRGKGQYDWGEIDRIVDSCQANGIHLLASVVKAPAWARGPNADMSVEGPPQNLQDYADFMGAMASRYKGRIWAYEIWNEQNLHYEWGNEPLDPGRYVQMLKLAYQTIKAQDPQAYVISGALTPTGYNDGVIAIDDLQYLERMYQAGLKSYCDGVGVHPSGYNMPPDADWQTYSDPSAGFTGPYANRHRSWSFRGTMESYRNVMVVYGDSAKRLWPTEFGWASVYGLGVGPAKNYEYAADNTEDEQAAWLVRAYQMAKNWGWVGPMFLWNLNYGPASGPADEKAAFGILYPNWTPRPAYLALATMPK
jgi:hypothetical protein